MYYVHTYMSQTLCACATLVSLSRHYNTQYSNNTSILYEQYPQYAGQSLANVRQHLTYCNNSWRHSDTHYTRCTRPEKRITVSAPSILVCTWSLSASFLSSSIMSLFWKFSARSLFTSLSSCKTRDVLRHPTPFCSAMTLHYVYIMNLDTYSDV